MSVPSFLQVLPTRVRRNYSGGALLEKWADRGEGRDGDQPEDWIASTVRATNPGLPPVAEEGLTRVLRPGSATAETLPALIAGDPEYFLGAGHLRERGQELGFLAKLLDSAIRLHVQVHPTAAFARQHLHSRYGKLETYVVLAVRDGVKPYLRLGFQNAPTRDEWRRIVFTQDMAAMDACFTPIPIAVGEIWRVPGGMPHAIGEGILMLEVMEPSDLVVRCEFEREGIVLPPDARYMGRDLDFCLDVFDYQARSVEAIRSLCRIEPQVRQRTATATVEQLVGREHTSCFTVERLTLDGPYALGGQGGIALGLVTRGTGTLEGPGGSMRLRPAASFILPAGGVVVDVRPDADAPLELILCRP